MADFVEPGRHVADDGRIVLDWPPTGRFADLWRRVEAALPDEAERAEAACLLTRWRDENSTMVGYVEDGVFYDCEPQWGDVGGWLNGG